MEKTIADSGGEPAAAAPGVENQLINILIVDDHAIVREGLRAMLETKPGFHVVGEAADGEQAIVQARQLAPDVILMDLVMPGMGGVAAIREIKRENQEANILVLSSFSDDMQIVESLRAGARGYLLKASTPADLIAAIRTVYSGEAAINPTVASKLIRSLNQVRAEPEPTAALTDRELEILGLVAEGLSNQDIGERSQISERTVGTHISNMLTKLGLENRTQLALFALRHGLASLFPEQERKR
jgi:NarL family two-component system response regulator LiaR